MELADDVMRRVPTELGVYGPATPYSAAPDETIPFEEGRRRVENGQASFINRGRAIRMYERQDAPATLRGASCQPGEQLIVDVAVNRQHRALQVLESWRSQREV
jgi:hypothetical protein